MNPTIKNILIFIGLGMLFIFIFIFFIKKPSEPDTLTSTTPEGVTTSVPTSADISADPALSNDFLSLLLNVQSIKLDNSIFSDIAFTTLRDSSIVLTPPGDEGRPNPFAPIGAETGGSKTPVKTTPKPSTP